MQKEVIPVQTLSGVELEKLSVHSVADAVRYFSGVQIKDYGGIGGLKTVNIRSMGSHHVGVFYDGIELGNAQNGVVDLGRFSLDNMQAVSMYNGQKSAIFQPAKDFASASSIYMLTRTPSFKNKKRDNLNIAVKGGSFATINPSILWEHKFSNKVSSSISAEYMYTSGRYKFSYAKKNGYDTTEIRKNGDVQSLRVEGAFFGTLKDGEWKAKVYLYNSERGYPGASVREEPGKFKHQDRQWDDNVFVQGSFRKNIGSFYSLLINGKYAYDYLHYVSDPRLDVSTMYVDNRYKQNEVYLSAANMFTIFDWWSAAISVDAQYNTLDADLIDFVYPQRYSLLTAGATSIRFDQFKLQASVLHTYVNDKTNKVGADAKD
ncbi:MAG: TonB-dependent receptor plug domain-containing protein, partial [Rikenellaceae bacterium]